jgi:hypothetical protein
LAKIGEFRRKQCSQHWPLVCHLPDEKWNVGEQRFSVTSLLRSLLRKFPERRVCKPQLAFTAGQPKP